MKPTLFKKKCKVTIHGKNRISINTMQNTQLVNTPIEAAVADDAFEMETEQTTFLGKLISF